MKFDLTQTIIGHKGEPIKKSETDEDPVTLGEILSMACVTADPQQHKTGEDKMKIYRILQKVAIEDDTECELKAEDITMLKRLVGDSYSVIIVGPVWDILEGKTPPAESGAESEDSEDDNKGKDQESGTG